MIKDDCRLYSGIFVLVENDITGKPKKITYELLSEARKLADKLNETISAIYICGSVDSKCFFEMSEVGCDNLIIVKNDDLVEYNTDLYTDIIVNCINEYKPSIVLFPGTENGRDLAPRVSARLRVGLTADCTGLEINDQGELVQIRPTYGGNLLASIITPNHRPQMASIRENIFDIVKKANMPEMNVISKDVMIDENSKRVIKIGFEPKNSVLRDVSEADIVLVGGYGVGAKCFPLLYELAERMNAAVGATRKAVDEGWATPENQIGQTGKIIAPDVCICFGVSGSLQHTIGIKGAKKIVAINNDPAAQIFAMSHESILANCQDVLHELLASLQSL